MRPLPAIVLVLALLASPAGAEERRVLHACLAGDDLFAGPASEPNLIPPEGMVAVVCRFDDSAFAIAALDRLTVTLPSGKPAELIVETDSVWEDLGEIAAVRFAFFVDEAELDGPEPCRILWGEEVTGRFRELPVFRPDPARRALYRTATWRPEGPGGDSQIASIEVVADSRSNYYSLLYLLPMAVLFVLLGVRKVLARDGVP
ncbi:MAG: hypothetical protein MUE73_12730 [Planctomycetes bacterium]|nr:hypothetical protein [Planctomycetota bacterium]